jgi:hypothetical protein
MAAAKYEGFVDDGYDSDMRNEQDGLAGLFYLFDSAFRSTSPLYQSIINMKVSLLLAEIKFVASV